MNQHEEAETARLLDAATGGGSGTTSGSTAGTTGATSGATAGTPSTTWTGAPVSGGGRRGSVSDPALIKEIQRTLEERAENIAYRDVTPINKVLLSGSITGQVLGDDIELAHQHVLGGLFRTFKGLQRFSLGLDVRKRKMAETDEDAAVDLSLISAAAAGLASRFSDAARYTQDGFAHGHYHGTTDEVADDRWAGRHADVDRDEAADTDDAETYDPPERGGILDGFGDYDGDGAYDGAYAGDDDGADAEVLPDPEPPVPGADPTTGPTQDGTQEGAQA